MNRIIKNICVISILVVIILAIAVFGVLKNIDRNIAISILNNLDNQDNLGNITAPYYYGGMKTGSTTINSNTATLIFSSRNSTTTNSVVCNITDRNPNPYVFLHPSTSTATTSVKINQGIVLYPTSSPAGGCREFPGFRGNMYGISQTTSTILWGLVPSGGE